MNYPFYYFGAGVKMWFDIDREDIYVKFEQCPTLEQLTQILDLAPKMLITKRRRAVLIRDCGEKIMYTSSEDDIVDLISSIYGNGEEKCTPEAFTAFAQDIDKWLLAVHAICPIEVVTRDVFSSSDILSDWHNESMKGSAELLEKWKKEPKEAYDDYIFRSMIELVCSYMKVAKLKPKYDADDIFEEDDSDCVLYNADLYATANSFSEADTYFDIANNNLTPLIAKGVMEGLNELQQKKSRKKNISIDINLDKESMMFFYGEDECEGDAFFEFKLGAVVKKCAEMLEGMENYSYEHALSNWFEDAVPMIPRKNYKKLKIAVWVPETGGDPVLETME